MARSRNRHVVELEGAGGGEGAILRIFLLGVVGAQRGRLARMALLPGKPERTRWRVVGHHERRLLELVVSGEGARGLLTLLQIPVAGTGPWLEGLSESSRWGLG